MIDIMGNLVWTEAQIDARVVAMIRSRYGVDDELRLARITIGNLSGLYTATAGEMAEVAEFQAHVLACREAGRQAHADNVMLRGAIDYEMAMARLQQPSRDDEIDVGERAAAQAIFDAVTPEAMALIQQREDHRRGFTEYAGDQVA